MKCSVCHKPGHNKSNPLHKGHIGFEGLARRVEAEEHAKHPTYSRARLERIGKGAAAQVYRERKKAGKGR